MKLHNTLGLCNLKEIVSKGTVHPKTGHDGPEGE